MRSNAHTRPPQRLNGDPKAGRVKSRGRHGSVDHCAHRRPNFTGDRSEARRHGAAHAALPPGWLRAGCACWCAPDGFAARRTHATARPLEKRRCLIQNSELQTASSKKSENTQQRSSYKFGGFHHQIAMTSILEYSVFETWCLSLVIFLTLKHT